MLNRIGLLINSFLYIYLDLLVDNVINYLNTVVGKGSDKIITQDALAKKIGCTPVSLNRYLNYQREMPVDIIFKIKKALNITDEFFMNLYQDFSLKEDNKINNIELKIKNLSNKNKIKLLDYIEYLIFQQCNEEKKMKELKIMLNQIY